MKKGGLFRPPSRMQERPSMRRAEVYFLVVFFAAVFFAGAAFFIAPAFS